VTAADIVREKVARSSPAIVALRVDQITAEVVAALRVGGVQSILLKGPSIARWLYADGSPRSYIDSDLLVPPERQSLAEAVLAELGFESVLADEDTPGWQLAAHLWMRPDGTQVDLHRTLVGIDAAPATVWKVLSTESRPMCVGGLTVEVLSRSAIAFHIALHAAQHGRADTARLEDLDRALSALGSEEWRDAAALSERLDAVPAFSTGLRLIPAGAELAARLDLPVAASTEASLRARNAPRGALGLEELARVRGLRAKLGLIARNMVPSPRFMRAWSPLARRGRIGLAAAYVWRPIAIVLRAGPAAFAWLRARHQASA
jgi:hypothetical protein